MKNLDTRSITLKRAVLRFIAQSISKAHLRRWAVIERYQRCVRLVR